MSVRVNVSESTLQPALGGESRMHNLNPPSFGKDRQETGREEHVTWTNRFGAIMAPTGWSIAKFLNVQNSWRSACLWCNDAALGVPGLKKKARLHGASC
jgi:hypothetical protein